MTFHDFLADGQPDSRSLVFGLPDQALKHLENSQSRWERLFQDEHAQTAIAARD
jgi:hypothetical protein